MEIYYDKKTVKICVWQNLGVNGVQNGMEEI
jgi:hypothetical protein